MYPQKNSYGLIMPSRRGPEGRREEAGLKRSSGWMIQGARDREVGIKSTYADGGR
jgi:hypothetical protein